MNRPIKFGSVCSGIEAASVAWHPLGWRADWLAEVESFPSAVLAHHYPDVPNLGDMTTIARRVIAEEVSAPDVLCGGTPCQAFSMAGLRESLADARGSLTLKFVEIANAIDAVRVGRGEDECVVFWENVPGVLNTRDNAFGCFLAALAGEDEPLQPAGEKWTNAGCVFGPQRAVAWRVLDAQYFGVAQRRRRVFVVASARTGFDPAEVLFEFEGVRRDTAPSRETQEVAPTIPSRSTAGGGLGTDFDLYGGAIESRGAEKQWPAEISCTLDTTFGTKQGLEDQHVNAGCPMFVPVAIHTLRGEGFDASEDGTGRGTPLVPHVVGPLACNTGPNGHDAGNFACNQAVDAGHVLPVAFAENSRGEIRLEGGDGQRTGALSTGGGKPGQGVPMICFPATLSGTQHASAEDICPALGAANPTAVAYTTGEQHGRMDGGTPQSPKLRPAPAEGMPSSGLHREVPREGVLQQARPAGAKGDIGSATDDQVRGVLGSMAVRRLLPVECERLQGFPDGYTMIPWRKKPADQCPDGPRYKALGNSWAVPVARWIGRRIQQHLASL